MQPQIAIYFRQEVIYYYNQKNNSAETVCQIKLKKTILPCYVRIFLIANFPITTGQLLSGVKSIWVQSFPSP